MSLGSDFDNALRDLENTCKVCEALEEMAPLDATSLRAALASKLGSKRITLILQRNGLDIGQPSVQRHRSEEHE